MAQPPQNIKGAVRALTSTFAIIIYDQTSKVPLLVLSPDDDASAKDAKFIAKQLPKNAKALVVKSSDLEGKTPASVLAANGLTPSSSGRCALVDGSGNVVGVVMADPSRDAIPGMVLVQSDTANAGWSWTKGGGFVAPPANPVKTPTVIL